MFLSEEEIKFMKAFLEYVVDKKDCFTPNEKGIEIAKGLLNKLEGWKNG